MAMMVPWYCDCAGQEYWRYRRAFSPGLQEFIEAVSFLHYIKHAALITREEVEEVIRAGTPNVLAHVAAAALLVWFGLVWSFVAHAFVSLRVARRVLRQRRGLPAGHRR